MVVIAAPKSVNATLTTKCRLYTTNLWRADGIIFATPVYFYSVTAQAKIIIERCYALTVENNLANKIGGVISVASSFGHVETWNTFNRFFAVNHMLSTDLVYGYARERGEIIKDKHAMRAAL